MMMLAMPMAGMAEGLLPALGGTYQELFPAICAPEYDAIWIEACAKMVGEEAAEAAAAMLKTVCMGELYRLDAVAAFAANPEAMQFNCSFINGVVLFSFDGNTISGTDEAGETVFSHEYSYVGNDDRLGLDMAVYQSADADSGEFNHFLLVPDIPAETYHNEFRYSDNLDELNQRMTGKYAYWLGAGIPAENTEDYAAKAIALFCEENLADGEGEEAA